MPEPAGEITAVQIGSRVVYRYRDAEGHVVLVDEPPPGYAASRFENMAPPVADAPEPVDAAPAATTAPSADTDSASDRILRRLPWLAVIGALALAVARSMFRVAASGRRALERWRSLTGVLDRSGYDTMHGVILPLQDGRTALFDHIVHTPSGLLVVGAERNLGGKSHAPNARKRAQAEASGAPGIQREVAKLDARVEAVKALAPGVPVFGRFVCTGSVPADASVARVMPLPTFIRALPEFGSPERANAAALSAAWSSLRVRAGRDEAAPGSASSADDVEAERPQAV